MKELKGIDENTAIEVSSKQEEELVLKIFERYGIKWNSGDNATNYSGYRGGKRQISFTGKGRIWYVECEKAIPAAEFIRLNSSTPLQQVEEREIIGYEAPFDMFTNLINSVKKGDLFVKSGFTYIDEKAHMYVFPEEIAESWKPVYREKPVFKVGDWVIEKVVTFPAHQVIAIDKDGDVRISATRAFTPNWIRLATPEEIEAARPREIWEKYPTWESLEEIEGYSTCIEYGCHTHSTRKEDHMEDTFASKKHAEAAQSFAMLSQLEKAWNEGKKGQGWTVGCDLLDGKLFVTQNTLAKHIDFASDVLARNSLELHGDLWRKYHMV